MAVIQIDRTDAPAASVFDFGADRIGNTTTTRYLFPGYAEDLAETSSTNDVIMTRDGTLQNLHVIHNVLGGGPVVITYTVEVNGVATSLAVGLAADSAIGANTTISVPIVAGDRVRVKVTKAANVVGPNNVHATVEIG